MDWKEYSVGALWLNNKGTQRAHYSGDITIDGVKHRVVVWPNSLKQEGEKTPDLRVYSGMPDDNYQGQQASSGQSKSEGQSEGQEEAIPF